MARTKHLDVHYLKIVDPVTQRALWLRFSALETANGFKRVAETWAVYYQRRDNREVAKLAIKQATDLKSFSTFNSGGKPGLRIGSCELAPDFTRGQIQSKGNILKWDLGLTAAQDAHFHLVPERLIQGGLVKTQVNTTQADLRVSGSSEINGETIQWNGAPASAGRLVGASAAHSWVWGHCNQFYDEQKRPVSFLFEGLTARARLLGSLPSPRLSSFYFNYQGKDYLFNTVWNSFRSRSRHTLKDWEFQAEQGDVLFRGKMTAEHRDFAGITYEDTDGSLIYGSATHLAQLTIWIYRRGKLETTLTSPGAASFEVASRQKNPYVPILI